MNHSQAVNISGATSNSTRARSSARFFRCESALTTHLGCTMLLQQVFRCPRLLRRTLYPDAVVTVTEARIVTHHHRDARNARVYEKPGHRRQSTDQHHHFESKNRIRNPGRYRLSTDNEWPPGRYPDRDPVGEGATEQSADERESTHATRRRADGFLELVTRCRCEDPNSTD